MSGFFEHVGGREPTERRRELWIGFHGAFHQPSRERFIRRDARIQIVRLGLELVRARRIGQRAMEALFLGGG